MREAYRYNKSSHAMEHLMAWEEQHEDGSVQHHFEIQKETHEGPPYVKIFRNAFRAATRALDKNSMDAALYIVDCLERSSNIARVAYCDLEDYLSLSNVAVNRIMQSLQKADVIRMYRRGQWMFNPSLAAGCYENRRQKLIEMYQSLESFDAKTARKAAQKKERAGKEGSVVVDAVGQVAFTDEEGCGHGCADVYTQSYEDAGENFQSEL